MPSYQKKPVVIQAIQFIEVDTFPSFRGELPVWFKDAHVEPCPRPPEGKWCIEADHLVIGTLEGMHIASPGDYIIQGVSGEIYPCKPAIFMQTYGEYVTEAELRVILSVDEHDGPLGLLITTHDGNWVKQTNGDYVFEATL